MKDSVLEVLERARWLDVVETGPLVAGDARFLREYFLPAHGRYQETLYRGALAELDARAARGSDPRTLARRGRVRRLLGDARGAGSDLDAALALDPDCSEARAFRAEMTLAQDPLGAVPALEAALEAEPRRPAYAVWLGYARALAGDPARAVESLDRAVGLDPSWRTARILRGILRERRDDLAGAEDDYSAFVGLHPSCPGIYALRAAVRWKRGDRPGGAADADRALLLHPENMDGFMRILYLTKDLKHPDEKRSQSALVAGLADDVLRQDPRCAWAYALKAEVVEDGRVSRKADKKTRLLRRAVELAPRNAWMRAFLGRAMSGLRKDPRWIRRGLTQLDRAVALRPEIGWIRSWRAEIREKLGEEGRALKDLDRGIAADPLYRLANAWRSALRERAGDDAGAAEDMAACVAVMPRPGFLHRLALIRWRLGEERAAVSDLTACISLSAKHALGYGRFSWLLGGPPPGRGRGRPLLSLFRRTVAAAGGRRAAFRLEPMWTAAPWKGPPWSEERLAELADAHGSDARLLSWLGRVRLDSGRFESAEEALSRALASDPAGFPALAWRGEARFLRGDLPGAREDLERAVALAPSYLPSRLWLALAEWSLGREPAALAALLGACRADPSSSALILLWARWTIPGFLSRLGSPATALPLAEFLLFAGRPRRAAGVLARAPVSALSAEGWVLRGLASGRTGRPDAAEADLSHAVCRDARAAAETLRSSLKRMPAIPEDVVVLAYFALAEAEVLSGREEESRRAYATALELDGALPRGCARPAPGLAAALLRRARVKRESGDLEGALDDARQAARLKPGTPLAGAAR